jgi:hypothetical protein
VQGFGSHGSSSVVALFVDPLAVPLFVLWSSPPGSLHWQPPAASRAENTKRKRDVLDTEDLGLAIRQHGSGPPTGDHLKGSETEIEELDGLAFEIGQETERMVKQGRYHDGHSAVVQVVARKN